MTSPCGPPGCTASWYGTAWAQKPPPRKAQNFVDSCVARRQSSWTRGRCSSPAPPSYWTCADGLSVPRAAPRARSPPSERTAGDMGYRCDTEVRPESLSLPGPRCVCTDSKGSIPPGGHGGPPCHGGGSWGAGWCDAWRGGRTCESLQRLRHWSTQSCVCGRTFFEVVSLEGGLRWAEEEGWLSGSSHVSPVQATVLHHPSRWLLLIPGLKEKLKQNVFFQVRDRKKRESLHL